MPEIAPFRALRYAPSAGDLSSLIAPPYDVIGPAERDQLEAKNPHNVVRLILEKERPGDGPQDNKYLRAGRWLREWIEEGVLAPDATPAIYALEQTFTALGEKRVRRGLLALLRLHEFREGIVLPHEKTLSGPKADRMHLMQATGANLSPIFGLFQDEKNEVWSLLAERAGAPVAEAQSDDGVSHRLWRVDDGKTVAAVQRALADRRVYIADGHHRYETALAYRRWLDEQHGKARPRGAHNYLISFLCSMSDPGLVVLPTHRLVHGLAHLQPDLFLKMASEFFHVDDAGDVSSDEGRNAALRKLAEAGRERHSFLLVLEGDPKARLLRKRAEVDTTHVHALPKNPTLRALDVSLLHGLILEHVLGLSPESQERQQNLRYLKDARDAVEQALRKQAQLSFLLNPTPMWQVRAVAEAGEVMPQKSTFFYPKLASGLVVRRIDADEEI